MLVEIEARCPACEKTGPIRVSAEAGRGAHTHCAHCRVGIIALTQDDGHVTLQAGEATGTAFLHQKAATPGPDGGATFVLPPERFGLRNAEYGQPPRYGGMSDEAFQGSNVVSLSPDVLFRPDGSPRPRRELFAHLGRRGTWQAQLALEIGHRLAGPAPMTHPPKVFLSYRWQGEAENAWVADLGAELKARGYDVFLDRDLPQTDTPNVPEIVSRVAECRYFLAIVDPGYLARIGSAEEGIKDGWVFDEFQSAARLSQAGLNRLLGFWRAGPAPKEHFRLAEPGRQGNLIDVRTPERLAAILDQVFPPLAGLAGTGAGAEARAALGRSHEAFMAGDAATALAEAGRIAELVPGSPDGHLQIIRIAHRTGDNAAGLAAAESALAAYPASIEILLDAAVFAAALGQPRKAASFAARVLDQEVEDAHDLAEAHAHMASALDDLGRVDAALGHARAAARLNPDRATNTTNLGYMLRRIGDPVSAVETLSAGLKRFPEDLLLLENYAAAVCEAGILDAAEKLVMLLHQRGGGDDAVGAMARAVMRARETGEPIRLVAPAELPDAHAVLECESCETRVLLGAGERDVCAICATPWGDAGGPCAMCGFEGRLPLLPAGAAGKTRCPFCRRGAIAVRGLDDRAEVHPPDG